MFSLAIEISGKTCYNASALMQPHFDKTHFGADCLVMIWFEINVLETFLHACPVFELINFIIWGSIVAHSWMCPLESPLAQPGACSIWSLPWIPRKYGISSIQRCRFAMLREYGPWNMHLGLMKNVVHGLPVPPTSLQSILMVPQKGNWKQVCSVFQSWFPCCTFMCVCVFFKTQSRHKTSYYINWFTLWHR
jgi:hypothetical protein